MLIYTDNNQIIGDQAQPVGGAILACKILLVKKSLEGRKGDLFIFVNPLVVRPAPLDIRFNGRRIGKLQGRRSDEIIFRWQKISIPKNLIQAGENEILFSSSTSGEPAWELALAVGSEPASDRVSHDGGKTWSNTHLGKYSAINGSFVVRLRINDDRPVPEPPFIHEVAGHEQLRRLRNVLPETLKDNRMNMLDRTRRLSTWLCSKLIYSNSGPRYCPWNFWRIIQANEENRRAAKAGKTLPNTVMCVHFAVAYVQAALALGWNARCVVSTEDNHTMSGHFFPEVWFDEWNRWGVVDPTGDFCFLDEKGIPRSAVELFNSRRKIPRWIRLGPGWKHNAPQLRKFIKTCVLNGSTYRNIAYWRRNDFFSHPDQTPPSHGSITYCEPDLVWVFGDDPYIPAFPFDCRKNERAK